MIDPSARATAATKPLVVVTASVASAGNLRRSSGFRNGIEEPIV
jgi:hypothetical protein